MNPSSTNSSPAPTAPIAPDTQKVAVGLLIAEAMSKSNNASQKQLQSQKEIDQELMEQNISTAIQQILENAPDNQTALAQVKSFLSEMDASDASWGSDIQSWISAQLKTANSYAPPQDLVDKLNDAMQSISQDLQDLESNERGLHADQATEANLNSQMDALKQEISSDVPWYIKVRDAFAIVGLGTAIAAVATAVAIDQFCVNGYQNDLDKDRSIAAKDEQAIKNDPGLWQMLSGMRSSDTLLQQESSENVTSYRATLNVVKGFNESIDALIKEFTESAGVSGK